MESANKQEVKTPLFRLVDKTLTSKEPKTQKRLGFMCGEIAAPADFDRMGEKHIEQVFTEAE